MERDQRGANSSRRRDKEPRDQAKRSGESPHSTDEENVVPTTEADRNRSRSPYREQRRDDRRRDRSPPSWSKQSDDRDGRKRHHEPQRSRDDTKDVRAAPARDRKEAPLSGSKDAPQSGSKDVQMKNGAREQEGGVGDWEADMMAVMGFKSFRSTHNTKVPGNDKNYAVYKVKKAEYRQYMNRVGGFNRPLSPSR